jgi:adenylate cyclase
MAIEIERKFLVQDISWRMGASGKLYRQGYLSIQQDRAVRIRVIENHAFLTVKRLVSCRERLEFEYEIPVEDACVMLEDVCVKPLIEKIRYPIVHQGLVWEVDEFLGENAGLVIAEIELTEKDQSFEKPAWVGKEVTHDIRYLNVHLVRHPYCRWGINAHSPPDSAEGDLPR